VSDQVEPLGRAAALRDAFDRGFAAPAASGAVTTEDFLAIRVGDEPYAVALVEVAGLHAGRRITRVPGPVAEHLGVVALRRGLHAVHDLGSLLGHPRSAAGAPSGGVMHPRWLLVPAGPRALALSFAVFEGARRVPKEQHVTDLRGHRSGPGVIAHLAGAVVDGELLRPIIHLASVIETVERHCGR
jgi:hypothetical protein